MRRKRAGGRRRRIKRGGNIFRSIGNFFTKTIPRAATTVYEKALKPAGQFIKDKKLISRGLSLIPDARAKAAAMAADAVGLGRKRAIGGRRRRRVRRRRGGGPLLNLMKDLVNKARTGAKKLGYGKQRKRRMRRRGGRRMGGSSALNGRLFLV